ncbi:MAG: hypothetical protein NZ534_04725, partial [Bacteroidia bacterium]|nr:hypothetical protein [Bacteroidia bacterium]
MLAVVLFALTSAASYAQTFKKVYAPPGGTKFEAVFGLDEHGAGYYLGGASQPSGRFVVKTDATGTVLWSRATATQSAVGGVVATGDGGAVLLAIPYPLGHTVCASTPPLALRKLDGAGSEVWARAYDIGTQGAIRIAKLSDGGTLVSAS